MSFSPAHNPRHIYYVMLIIWVILFVTVMSWIMVVDLNRAEKEFADNVNMHFQQANSRVHINESILEGFAAMISAANDLDRTRIRAYARQMLGQYPHIYMFEIVEKVSDDKLELFTEYYRQSVYPEFEVKRFSYESDRHWQSVKRMPYHLPIVFMEPFPPESRKVLGLDISSNDFFMRSLQRSEQQERAVSTDPFELVEGDLAYLLHRPIPEAENEGVFSVSKSGAQGGFAVLVIRADTLLDRDDHHAFPRMRELLYNPVYPSTDTRGHLYLHKTSEAGWLESRLFPSLSISKDLDSKSQPFVLLVQQQLGWSLISWGKLGLTLFIALITFGAMVIYSRLYFRGEMERSEMTVKLFHLANHDALTGLANRNLLSDRLNHAIAQSARQKGKLAVLFLDLEEFKQVNDTYGHETGDGVLRRAAERLRACVRAGDTIARLGGDEFVLVLENITSQEDVEHIVEKIKAGFEQPFDVNSHSIKLGISIGSAIYPQDGTDMETLIQYADYSMYEDKRSSEQTV